MEPQIVIAVITGLFILFAAIVAFIGTRGKTQADAKTALDSRIDARVSAQLEGAWERIDALEKEQTEFKKNDVRYRSAVGRILRAIANQWPSTTGPDLDPADIAEIEDTIPSEWIRKK